MGCGGGWQTNRKYRNGNLITRRGVQYAPKHRGRVNNIGITQPQKFIILDYSFVCSGQFNAMLLDIQSSKTDLILF